MKKILLTFLIAVIFIMTMGTVAFAADTFGPPEIMNEFLTWNFLGTMGGVVMATTLITQFLKMPLDKVWKIPTRFIVFLIALILLFAFDLVTGAFKPDRSILLILDAVVASMTSMGTYENTFKRLENKQTG